LKLAAAVPHDAGGLSAPVSSRPIPLMLRILSGIAAVVVFLFGLVLSFGAILGSPLGMWLVQRWTRRNDRRPSRIASVVGGALASSALAGLLWSVIFALAPRPTPQELQSAVAQSQTRAAVKLPAWYAKAFPQAARADSASEKLIQSPGFMRMTLMLGAVFLAFFFGVLGGVLGWSAVSLARVAWLGRAA